MTTEVLLQTSLQIAVPIWIERVRSMTPDARIARAHEAVDVIASAGDTILYRVPGKTAKNFNVLAEAIAIMAFCPGGVTVFGEHWEASDGIN